MSILKFTNKIEKTNPIKCKVCGHEAFLFDVVDFNKFCNKENYYSDGLIGIPIYYRKCSICNLIFSNDFDDFSLNDFVKIIYNNDYIKYDPEYLEKRPFENAVFLESFLSPIKQFVKGLDYGGGNGLTASILNRNGWNFTYCDPISHPVSNSKFFSNFNTISSIEVFEHIPFPDKGMEEMLDYASNDCLLIIGTLINNKQLNRNNLDWWYASPRNGHITLFSKESLRFLFEKYGFSYFMLNDHMHIGIRGSHPITNFFDIQNNNSYFNKASRFKTFLKKWL
jgi:2-polyprenyl-6-hydroxyphenyl methylase/3-demethylubiquinone-9 3-methyltransferase